MCLFSSLTHESASWSVLARNQNSLSFPLKVILNYLYGCYSSKSAINTLLYLRIALDASDCAAVEVEVQRAFHLILAVLALLVVLEDALVKLAFA